MTYPWHLYLMASFYILAGILHFIQPKMYRRIMPNYLPKHDLLIGLSGVSEMILGITICMPPFKNFSLYAIIVMLSIFLLVHFYMLKNETTAIKIPKWILFLRIPLQFVLMYWAYSYIQL